MYSRHSFGFLGRKAQKRVREGEDHIVLRVHVLEQLGINVEQKLLFGLSVRAGFLLLQKRCSSEADKYGARQQCLHCLMQLAALDGLKTNGV
jgi:hypothetical protein